MSDMITRMWELQQRDLKIDELNRRIADIPKRRSVIDGKIAAIDDEKRHREDAVATIGAEKAAREKEIAQEEDKIKAIETRMGSIRNPQDYQEIRRKVEMARKANRAREDEVIRKMEELEKAQAELATFLETYEQERSAVVESAQVFVAEESEISAERDRLQTERDSFATTIDPSLLTRYEQLRKTSRGIAVGRARNTACEGCFMNLPPQLFNLVIKGEAIHNCPYCQRFLVYVPEPKKESEQAVAQTAE